MLDKLISKSTDFLVHNQVIDAEDREIYEYGFHALYNNIIDIASIILISLWLNKVPQTFMYHITFITLRNIAGGYHANTHIQCFIISTTIWLLSLWSISYLEIPIICLVLSGLTVILIWLKAPLEHKNSPLSKRKNQHMKILSRLFSLFFFIAILGIYLQGEKSFLWIATSFAYGMISYMVLALPRILTKKH